jgi:hypothetical protein
MASRRSATGRGGTSPDLRCSTGAESRVEPLGELGGPVREAAPVVPGAIHDSGSESFGQGRRRPAGHLYPRTRHTWPAMSDANTQLVQVVGRLPLSRSASRVSINTSAAWPRLMWISMSRGGEQPSVLASRPVVKEAVTRYTRAR